MKKVLGIGNALVDVLIGLEEDDFIAGFGLAKGSMTLVDQDTMNNILNKAASAKMEMRRSSGGSVANAIHGMSQLGAPVGYIGKTGADEYGAFFRSYMEQNNISATLFQGKQATGKSMVMVSKDSERTMATYLGAAIELDAADLTIEPFKGYDYFFLEGYLVQNYPLVEKAAKLARQAECQIAVDLASFNIVKENLDFLHAIVDQYVDIVFANEEEAKSFTGKNDPQEALVDIAEKCRIAVVKIGKEGSLIKAGCRQYNIPPITAAAVDTTGAGDLYAAGFFYGLTCGHSLDICGKIGSITSGKIVEVVGAKMDDRKWQEVIHLAKKI